jgi:DNA-binding Xre family transcriptional regulator
VRQIISYEPFWKTLKQKNVSTYALIEKHKISPETLTRMRKGKGITTAKLDDFCKILKCEVSDIIKFIDEG